MWFLSDAFNNYAKKIEKVRAMSMQLCARFKQPKKRAEKFDTYNWQLNALGKRIKTKLVQHEKNTASALGWVSSMLPVH